MHRCNMGIPCKHGSMLVKGSHDTATNTNITAAYSQKGKPLFFTQNRKCFFYGKKENRKNRGHSRAD